MKNLPDEEWLHSLEARLRDYTEEPDAALWNKIAEKINDDREPAWIPWSNRAAVLVIMMAIVWLWSTPQIDVSRVIPEDLGKKEYLSEETDKKDPLVLNEDKPIVNGIHYQKKNTDSGNKTDNDKTIPGDKKIKSLTNNGQPTSVENGIIKEALPVSGTPYQSETVTVSVKTVKADSLKQSLTKHDSAKNLVAETAKKKSVKKKRTLTLYSSITPMLTYQKVIPYKNDGIVINGFNARPILSGERLGLSIEAGVQGRLSEKLEFYGGLSVYKQSQTLTYHYQSDGPGIVSQQADFNYTVTPGTHEKKINYNMLTVGGQAGILYLIRDGRLKHKFGAGLSYQQGTIKPVEGTYSNDRSKYGFYQIFYRNEYAINNTVSIFVQPFYMRAVFSKEKLDEPFKLTPHRAGIGFGLVYQLN